jgi:hypothetical protein
MHRTHPNYIERCIKLIRITEDDTWNSTELYRKMHKSYPNYTGWCMELVQIIQDDARNIRIIQDDAWNSSELYRVTHGTNPNCRRWCMQLMHIIQDNVLPHLSYAGWFMKLNRIIQGDSVCNSQYTQCACAVKTIKLGNVTVKCNCGVLT